MTLPTANNQTVAQVQTAVSPASIEETKRSIKLLQELVRDSLERGIDYGRVPGTQGESLWDPGAAMIISSFNCYVGDRRILSLVDDGIKIAVLVEVPIYSRSSQLRVGSGIGAASTLETKYKYRWVRDATEWGYDEEAVQALRTRFDHDAAGGKVTEYRIPNPEHDELLNTLVKMASKRAEVDAAESLPGVSSVLRRMFDPKYQGKPPSGSARPQAQNVPPAGDKKPAPDWSRFWGEVRRMGLTQDDTRKILDVVSMSVYLDQGGTLDQALEQLRTYVGRPAGPGTQGQGKT